MRSGKLQSNLTNKKLLKSDNEAIQKVLECHSLEKGNLLIDITATSKKIPNQVGDDKD